MMTNCKLNPFDLPEIVSRVGEFLSRDDIISCLRISKAFHSTLVKRLWKTISLDSKYPTGEALHNNKKYIQKLVLYSPLPEEYRTLQSCNRLKDISFYGTSSHDASVLNDLSNLIKAHRTTIARLYFDFGDSSSQGIWGTLLECARLENLAFSRTQISNDEVDLFFQVCKKIKNLDIESVSIDRLPSDYLNDDKNSFIFPNMSTLYFNEFKISNPPHPHTSAYCLGILTRRCPNLHSLGFYDYLSDAHTSQHELVKFHWAAFRDHPYTLTNLSNLRLHMEIRDEDMAALLRQITELRELDVPECTFGPLSVRELLADEQEVLDGGIIVRKRRSQKLCDTIEVLIIDNRVERNDGVVQVILSSCPRLKRLKGPKITVAEIVNGAEWVCADLVSLAIRLVADVDSETAEGMGKQRIVFRQLGKLTELEILDLTATNFEPGDIRTLDLRLKAGLDELVSLKRLRSLSFDHDKCQQMEPEDATWIINNWPRMTQISGAVNQKPGASSLVMNLFKSHNIYTWLPF
ncbi:hypothetical protein BCR41DRAFT_365052 [Lobosporangium transversale]|uniref:F-box domain-containing protein n=1 Tax=Lobosporangium transversale TaxID=64571 RepID=A0A1Y2G861_9FUNG|nr:hypothetical protein BCR41DRAFT_365052 [Lobosporangium transversale]ORY95965.1 hypothetical protein BCR41DRAFT_365052 [Lobosporangium transversale]|eukprot:XP_021875406.1 hypothetical protein BCR41DRAFT_365052 [Lobosporangium transversale]